MKSVRCHAIWTFFCFFFVFVADVHGTTVIAVKTPDDIFIGADSKISIGGSSAQLCKLVQSGNIFFAFAGHPIIKSVSIKFPLPPVSADIFNAFEIATDMAKTETAINDRVTDFVKTIESSLSSALDFAQQANPDAFCATYFQDNNIVLQAVIAGFNNNIPVLYGREFRITGDCHSHPVNIDTVPTSYIITGNIDTILYGEHSKILARSPQRLLESNKIAEYIKEWITWEINDRPDIVGPPIDILHITKKKVEWVEDRNCSEIDQQFFH